MVWVVGGGGFRGKWWVPFDSLVGRSLVCKLLISDSPRSTKIGKGWKEFCNQHQFKEGDHVLFQVDHADADEFITVFVNKCLCDD